MLWGRSAEVAAIDEALAAARDGRGQLLIVVGEAGLGKTRLADEATQRALSLGFRVAWGRTWEGAGAPPAWPWAQIARELLDEGVRLPPADAAELAALLPELESSGVAAARNTTGFRTFDVLLGLLKRAARATPRLFVLDDLHAADDSTLLGLQFIARGLRHIPAVIVATHRDAEARVRTDVPQLFERIAREGMRLPLARLAEADVAALVNERLGAVAAESSRAIYRSTEGNPLYVNEVVRVLQSRRTEPGDPVRQLPDGIRAAVDCHVALLTPQTRQLLGVAALFGRSFSRAGLGEVAGATADAVETALREAVKAGVLEPVAEGAAFTHILLAEALLAALPPSQRAKHHAAIAAWWRAHSVGDARLTEIAHHLLEAGGDAAEAVGLARRAASRAIRHLAFDQAADLYARASAFVPRLQDGQRVGIDLLVGRAEALAKGGSFDEALALCKEAARQARAAGAPDLEARAALASASHFNFLVPHPEVVALLERALEIITTDDGGWRARLLAKLSCSLYPSPVPGKTVGLAREAIAIARPTGDPDVLLDVLNDVVIASLPESLPAAAAGALSRELSSLARARDDALPLLRGEIGELLSHLQLGETHAFDERIRALEAGVAASGATRDRGLLCTIRALLARLQGRFAEAEACIEESYEVGLPEDQPRHRALHLWAQAYTRGNLEDLQAARALGELRIPAFGSVWVAAAMGHHEETKSHLQTTPTGDFASPSMVAALAEAAVVIGDKVAAAALYPLLAPAAGELLLFGPVIGLGPTDRILGGLAAVGGDRAGAETHLQKAVALCELAGAVPFLARSLAQLGRLVSGDDPARARRLLDRASTVALSVGMTTLAQEIAGDAARPGEPRAAPVQSPPTDVMALERGGDEWVLSCGAAEVRLRHGKGLAYLDELIRHPHREIHVAELYALGGGPAELGDAGPTIDASARRQYERRLVDLEEEVREAEAFADTMRASRAEREIDSLAEELARAVGLGGRERRVGSLTERARINVQRRLKEVITRVGRSDPALARHLESTVKTGTFCCYRPLGDR